MRLRGLPALLAVVYLSCVALWACAPQNPATGAEVLKEIQFLDSFSFDRKLSASLGTGQDKVDVIFPAVITLNNIPERMDKWLSKVEKFGGKVEIQAEPEQGRGLITEIFSFFVKIYEIAEENLIYAPAKDYNVLIGYKAQSGIVTRLSFVRKQKPADAAQANATEAKPAAPEGTVPAPAEAAPAK